MEEEKCCTGINSMASCLATLSTGVRARRPCPHQTAEVFFLSELFWLAGHILQHVTYPVQNSASTMAWKYCIKDFEHNSSEPKPTG